MCVHIYIYIYVYTCIHTYRVMGEHTVSSHTSRSSACICWQAAPACRGATSRDVTIIVL